jgi:hypothetical protein
MNVGPCPSSGTVVISCGNEDVKYEVTNSTGQMIASGKLIDGKALVDLSMYPNGIYFVRASSFEKASVRKLILQK